MALRRPHAFPAAGTMLLAALALGAQDAQAQQIVLGKTRNLEFGRFVAGSGGTIVVSPLGVRSRTGGVVLLNSPAVGQAAFNVGKSDSGAGNQAVIMSLPPNGSVWLSSGASSMAVNSFVANPASLLTVPNNGTTLSIGASLVVAPNQPAGDYTGSFPLTVNFQ